jgi:hypothetical protein
LKTIQAHSLKTRRVAAAAILSEAATRDLEALGKLAAHAAQLSPELGTAVTLARGSERDLIATVGEIIAEDQQKRAREAEQKAAFTRSQQQS